MTNRPKQARPASEPIRSPSAARLRGYAHEINNYLTAILTNVGVARLDSAEGSPLHTTLQEIEDAALQACKITQRLLAGVTAGEENPVPAATAPAKGATARQRGKVLIMDDETRVRTGTGKMLQHLGYEVAYAADGEEALALYEQAAAVGQPFDVVLMDLTIANGRSGEETIQALIAIDPEVRAIASSGYFSNPDDFDYASLGFKGMIAKPYRMDELRRVLQEVLSA